MRTLVVSVLTSLDGYFEGRGKDLGPMPFEDAFDNHNHELLSHAGTIVYGSRWFPENWDYWSGVAADDSQTEQNREIARAVLSTESVIISDSFSIDPADPWAATTRVVPRAQGPAEVERLKQSGDGDIVMFGSATTWNPLLERGLVDELIVLVGPALLGDGSKLYSGPRAGLTLLSARVLPGSQLVALRYDARPARDV